MYDNAAYTQTPAPVGDGRYRYEVASCAAKEMGDEVRVVVKYQGHVVKDAAYSVKGYCDAVISGAFVTSGRETVWKTSSALRDIGDGPNVIE